MSLSVSGDLDHTFYHISVKHHRNQSTLSLNVLKRCNVNLSVFAVNSASFIQEPADMTSDMDL